jgi:RNA recognition motif-containing protein
LFVGNMPYGATEADLRTHFSTVGAPSQIVIPVDRETGRPRGVAFVEYLDRAMAEEAINRFNQQAFMGRTLAVSEARPREERPSGFRPGGFGGPPRPGGGAGGGGFRPGPGGPPTRGDAPGRNFGPPKKKATGNEKRWESKERGPKGPIKERFSGRLGGLQDLPDDDFGEVLDDFDDIASREPKDAEGKELATKDAGTKSSEANDATSAPARDTAGDSDSASDE